MEPYYVLGSVLKYMIHTEELCEIQMLHHAYSYPEATEMAMRLSNLSKVTQEIVAKIGSRAHWSCHVTSLSLQLIFPCGQEIFPSHEREMRTNSDLQQPVAERRQAFSLKRCHAK